MFNGATSLLSHLMARMKMAPTSAPARPNGTARNRSLTLSVYAGKVYSSPKYWPESMMNTVVATADATRLGNSVHG